MGWNHQVLGDFKCHDRMVVSNPQYCHITGKHKVFGKVVGRVSTEKRFTAAASWEY